MSRLGEAGWGVLDGVVEEVEDRGAEVLGDAGDAEADAGGDGGEGVMQSRGEVVAGVSVIGDALGDERGEVNDRTRFCWRWRWPSSPALRTCSTVARRRSESACMME